MGSIRKRSGAVKRPLASTSKPFSRWSPSTLRVGSSPSRVTSLCSAVSTTGGLPSTSTSLPRNVSAANAEPAASARRHRQNRIDSIVTPEIPRQQGGTSGRRCQEERGHGGIRHKVPKAHGHHHARDGDRHEYAE